MQSTIDKASIDKAYEPLFNLMTKYNLALGHAAMDEILEAASMVSENFAELYRNKCDASGCDKTAVTQGIYFSDSGYWHLCELHSGLARLGACLPTMKPEAIQREASRKADNINGLL